jgi:hypothetical protein
VVERETPPEGLEIAKWMRYNRHPFSPYARTEGGSRSVAVVIVKGKPFCRKRIKDSSKGNFVPTLILGAVGGDDEFIMEDDAPLRLSKFDFRKWHERGFKKNDAVVVIGGKSRRSKMFEVDKKHANRVASYLLDGEKEKALLFLEYEGYDVGSAGSEYGGSSSGSRSSGMSMAEELQRSVEEGEVAIQSLSHQERVHLGNRLLKLKGYDEAFEWFRDAFGPDFDEGITRRQLRSIAREYDDLDVEVP